MQAGWAPLMIGWTSDRLKLPSSDLLRAGKRTREGFAAAVAVAGSLIISSTAPALIEGAGARATDIHRNDNSGLDRYGALLTGDSYRPADVFAATGAASSFLTEAYPIAGSHSCNPSEKINTTVPATGVSAPALATHEGICFGPHDVIEYYEFHGNADRRSVDRNTDGVPPTVRSHLADNQLFQVRPVVVATADDGEYESRESPANASRSPNVSTRAKLSPALTSHARGASALRPAGCSRCPGQVAQSSPRRAKSFAFVFPSDFFRNARSVRRERLPSGVARQREAPRVAAWNFPRG